MEPWETMAQRRACWSELWRSKSSTSALIIQKLQELSTTLAMPWETLPQRKIWWSEHKARSSKSFCVQGSPNLALTIQKLQQLSTDSPVPMEPWETMAQRRACWSELWRSKSSTSALTIQKLQQLSTTLAMPMGLWETIWHKEGLAGASFEDQRAALRHWSSRSCRNSPQPWQCPCSLGRPSHTERLDGASPLASLAVCKGLPNLALTIQKLQQLSTDSPVPMEPWETMAQRRACWSELWRSKSSTSALTIQKLQQLSTDSPVPMGLWETIWHKEGLAGASFEDQRAALRHWSSRSCRNSPQPWQCPCSLGRPSHTERLDGASLSSLQQVFLCARVSQFGPDHPEVAATLNGLASAHGALGDYMAQRRTCWSELWRSKSSTSALIIQKLQELSTTLSMPMYPWKTLPHRKTWWSEPKLAPTSLSVCKGLPIWPWPSRSCSNSQRTRQCAWSLGRLWHKEGLAGASFEDQRAALRPWPSKNCSNSFNELGNAHGALGDYMAQRRTCWSELWRSKSSALAMPM